MPDSTEVAVASTAPRSAAGIEQLGGSPGRIDVYYTAHADVQATIRPVTRIGPPRAPDALAAVSPVADVQSLGEALSGEELPGGKELRPVILRHVAMPMRFAVKKQREFDSAGHDSPAGNVQGTIEFHNHQLTTSWYVSSDRRLKIV